jgi:Ring finger domain
MDNLETECPICTKQLGLYRYTTECGHQFHKQCIEKWLTKSETCPLCRNGLTLKKCCLSKHLSNCLTCARLKIFAYACLMAIILILCAAGAVIFVRMVWVRLEKPKLQSNDTPKRLTEEDVFCSGRVQFYNSLATKLCGFNPGPRLNGLSNSRETYMLDIHLNCIIIRTMPNFYSTDKINGYIGNHKMWTNKTIAYRIENCCSSYEVYVARNYYSPSEYNLENCSRNATTVCKTNLA